MVSIELSEPSPAPTLVLTSTLPNSTPREDTKIFVANKAGECLPSPPATTHGCPGRAPIPWRALTKSCHQRPAKNGRPLFMNKDALHFLKCGRGGAWPVLRGGDPLPARVKKVDPTGFSATAISCVENLGANTWQDTTELVTVRLGDVAHPKVVAHLCSNRFHDTSAWSQASRYLNCVRAGVVGPFSRRRHWDPLADVARTRSRRNLLFRFRPTSTFLPSRQ